MALADIQLDPLPPATERDIRAAQAYLLSRAEGVSRKGAEWQLGFMARELGVVSWETCPWTAIDYLRARDLMDRIHQGRTPETVNGYLSTLKGLVHEARRARIMKPEDPASSVVDLPYYECSREEPAAGRALTHAELRKLIAVCEADHGAGVGARDKFAFLFLWATGFRRATFLTLDLEHISIEHATVTVRGKGKRRHVMPLDDETMDALDDYLKHRGDWAGPLFVSSTGGRYSKKGLTKVLKRLRFSPVALYEMCLRRAVQADVERFSPHDFRRTAITEWIDRAGIRVAQRLANHSNPAQTARYDRAGFDAMREGVSKRKISAALGEGGLNAAAILHDPVALDGPPQSLGSGRGD